jgi:hypothetical protein
MNFSKFLSFFECTKLSAEKTNDLLKADLFDSNLIFRYEIAENAMVQILKAIQRKRRLALTCKGGDILW